MIRLEQGDCLEVLKSVESDSVQLVIADLPYGQTDYEWDCKIDLQKLWIELKRVGKENTCYMFFTTTRFGIDLIQSNPGWFRYDLVVKKSNTVGFLNSAKMPMREHEMIYIFYKKLPIYNVKQYHTKIGERTGKKHLYLGARSSGNVATTYKYDPPMPTSILQMKNYSCGRNHPTEKTGEILQWLIKMYSNPGDVILDPTMGSGSTGVACKALGRDFIGIELTEKYFNIASNRINNEPDP